MCEFDGIADQVEQNLLQAQGVAEHRIGHVCRHIEHRLYRPVAHTHTQHRGGSVEQLVQGKRGVLQMQLIGLYLGEIQYVVDQSFQDLGRQFHFADIVALARIQRRLRQQVVQADHRVEWGAQLVAHARQELALGAAGVIRRLLGLLQSQCQKFRVGDIGIGEQNPALSDGPTANGQVLTVVLVTFVIDRLLPVHLEHESGQHRFIRLAGKLAFVVAEANHVGKRQIGPLGQFRGETQQFAEQRVFEHDLAIRVQNGDSQGYGFKHLTEKVVQVLELLLLGQVLPVIDDSASDGNNLTL